MKKYIAPDLRQVKITPQDVIAASPLYDYLQENNYEIRSFDFEDVAPTENPGE